MSVVCRCLREQKWWYCMCDGWIRRFKKKSSRVVTTVENQIRLLLTLSFLVPSWCLYISITKLYINVSIIIFSVSAPHMESCHWCRISRFTKHWCLRTVLSIYLLFWFGLVWFGFLHTKGRWCKQREEIESLSLHHQGWQSTIPPFSGPFPLNTWSRGILLPSETNFTWQMRRSSIVPVHADF